MIELDISKIPGLKRVEYYDDVIHMWEGDSRHPHGVYVSSVEWCEEMIRYKKESIEKNKVIVEAGGWPHASTAKYDIERAEKDLLHWTYISLPCAIDFEKRMAEDQEVTKLTKEEKKELRGKLSGKKLAGPDSTISSLHLQPGERFIDNYHYIKYVFQSHYRYYRELDYFNIDEYKAVNEQTGKMVIIRDHDSFQKLDGKGKVTPTDITLEKIAVACGLELWEYRDYLLTTVERYMRINKLLDTNEEDVKKVIALIKSVS